MAYLQRLEVCLGSDHKDMVGILSMYIISCTISSCI